MNRDLYPTAIPAVSPGGGADLPAMTTRNAIYLGVELC